MNSSEQYSDAGYGISGLTYAIIFSVGVFLLILLIAFACTRVHFPPTLTPSYWNSALRTTDQDPITIEQGLDESTLCSYPKLLYSQAKKVASTASCCTICLVDYKETDMLRLLPECSHLFHLNCIDAWMRLRSTCPICRSTPVPTPDTALIADVDPLATRQDTR